MHGSTEAARGLGLLPRLATVVALTLALSACGSSSNENHSGYAPGDPKLAAPNPAGGPIVPFLADGKSVMQALNAIAGRSGRPLRVITMNADRANGLTVHVQEPKKRVNVDEYVVAANGTLSGPTPVKMISLSGGPITAGEVDLEAFDPKTIHFARLAQTAREAIAKSTFSDARVSQWEISGVGPDDRRFIYLEASRGRPVATVNTNLTIAKMQF